MALVGAGQSSSKHREISAANISAGRLKIEENIGSNNIKANIERSVQKTSESYHKCCGLIEKNISNNNIQVNIERSVRCNW